MELPDRLLEHSFPLGKGEYAWQREAAVDVIQTLPYLGLAILGGALVQVKGGEVQALPGDSHCWETAPRNGQDWVEYCLRTANHSVKVLENWDLESEFPDTWQDLWFTLRMVGVDG